MAYLLTQIVFSLLLAGLLGGVVGWLLNGYRAAGRQQNVRAEVMRQSLALSQAETDNKMIEDDFRELKQRSEESIALLTEDTKQIPALKKNLEKSQTLVRQLLQKHDAEMRHVQAENRVLASKMRDLENREKAVTRLQMDLNTERLKLRTQNTTRNTDQATSAEVTQGGQHDSVKSVPAAPLVSAQPAVQAQATAGDTETPAAEVQGLQTDLPLDMDESSADITGLGSIEQDENADDDRDLTHSSDLSARFVESDASFDDILDKADDVLTRFQDDPSNELESFQIELDQELDAIRRDLAEDGNAEPLLLQKEAPGGNGATEYAHPINQELLDQLGTATTDNDLQTIFGIGPVTERTLKSIGISSFAQIAKFKREHIEYVAEVLQIFPGRIERDNWVASAKKLVASDNSSSDNNFLETSEANTELEDA